MYVNMNSEKLTVPLDADGKFALDLARSNRNMTSKKTMAVTGVAILLIVNVSLLVVTVLTLTRVKNLENEVTFFRNSLTEVKQFQDDFMNGIVGSENEDLYEDVDEQTEIVPDSYIASEDYPESNLEYDYYYDQPNETKRLGDFIENLKKVTNLTKDGKDTSRTKRNVVAATQDGVLINPESYAERKAMNETRRRHIPRGHSITAYPSEPSSFGRSPWDSSQGFSSEEPTSADRSTTHHTKPLTRTSPSDYSRHRQDPKALRQVKKSFLKSGDSFSEEVTSSPDFTIVRDFGRRRYRQRNLALENLDENRSRMGRAKLPAIHYSGDTSKYVVGQHTNFNGNGHMKHPQRTFLDWKVSDWAVDAGMDTYFTMDEGVLTIKESGIYFIYAQIYYLDEHDTTGFRVHKNRDTILQCTITIHAREKKLIGNTCYTAGVEYLSEGDTISLADVTDGRYSLFEPGKSFFGLIKLSDLKLSSL